jgi:hypothetical protein
MPPITRRELLILGAILAGFGVLAILVIREGSPLGWDEAVYSLRARDFAEAREAGDYWASYRAPGLPFLLQVAWWFEPTEPYLRLVVTGFGFLAVVATWALGRILFRPSVGLVAAGGLALTPTILASSTQVWPDVPGAALGLSAVAVFAWAAAGERVRWWAVAAAPIATLATLVRFGAPNAVAIGLTGIALMRWDVVWRSRPVVAATAGLTALGVGIVLLVPGVTGATSSPYSLVSDQAFKYAWNRGFTDFGKQLGFLAGGMIGAVMVLGVAAALFVAARGGVPSRPIWTAAGIGAVNALWVAISINGEVRYLSPAFPWIWITAAAGVVWLAGLLPRELAVTAAVLVVGISAIAAAGYWERSVAATVFSDSNRTGRAIKAASLRIQDDAGAEACGVVVSYEPVVEWYSECETSRFDLDTVDVDDPDFPSGGPVFMLLAEDWRRQPEGDVLAGYLEIAGEPLFSFGEPGSGRGGYVEVFEIRP